MRRGVEIWEEGLLLLGLLRLDFFTPVLELEMVKPGEGRRGIHSRRDGVGEKAKEEEEDRVCESAVALRSRVDVDEAEECISGCGRRPARAAKYMAQPVRSGSFVFFFFFFFFFLRKRGSCSRRPVHWLPVSKTRQRG